MTRSIQRNDGLSGGLFPELPPFLGLLSSIGPIALKTREKHRVSAKFRRWPSYMLDTERVFKINEQFLENIAIFLRACRELTRGFELHGVAAEITSSHSTIFRRELTHQPAEVPNCRSDSESSYDKINYSTAISEVFSHIFLVVQRCHGQRSSATNGLRINVGTTFDQKF